MPSPFDAFFSCFSLRFSLMLFFGAFNSFFGDFSPIAKTLLVNGCLVGIGQNAAVWFHNHNRPFFRFRQVFQKNTNRQERQGNRSQNPGSAINKALPLD